MSQSKIGRLLISFVVIVVAVHVGVAQQVQSVKSPQSIQCGGKTYELRLMAAAALVNNISAKSLAIVLTPDDRSESKVFSVYWTEGGMSFPSYRDNTNGNGGKVFDYGDGIIRPSGQSVVESFFSEAKCSTNDPQVIRIRSELAAPNSLSSTTLRDLAAKLGLDADEVKDSTANDLTNIPNRNEFAAAIHKYVPELLAAESQTADPGGNDSSDDEVKRLRNENTELKTRLSNLETGKGSSLGNPPWWLLVIFAFMVVLSLGGITFFGLALYHWIQLKSKKQSRLAVWLLGDPQASRTQIAENLKKGLKELQEPDSNSRDGSNGIPPVATELAPDIKKIQDTLQGLTSDVGTIKMNVEGFNSKLDVRMKANQALQNIWHRLYTSEYTSEQTDKLVKDVGLVIELYNSLKSQCVSADASTKQATDQVRHVVTELNTIRRNHFTNLSERALLTEIADSINIRLTTDARRLDELRIIEDAVRNYTGKDKGASDVVTKLIGEHIEVQRKLEKYEYPRDLNRAIDAVFSVHQKVTDEVRRALPNQEGRMGELVTSLADEYLKVKPEAERAQGLEIEKSNLRTRLDHAQAELEAGKQLAAEIALEFNLNPDRLKENEQAIGATLNRLRKERASSVYLQLRLGLSSALIAFEKTTNTTGSEERNEVLEALNLHKVKDGIRNLLTKMEECTGEQLWHQALSEGFSEKWLHYLIRADLLLRTYYVDQKEFGWLSKVVSFACSAILAALHEFQVEVVQVSLLGERPKEMDTESVYSGVRNLRAVRDKVLLKLTNGQTQELVVDVTSFPYFVKGIQENRGRAALANPSAWVQH